jgi:RecB family exonuclease
MPRIVYTAIPASTPDYREIEVITPHPAAARAVGAPHRSLQAFARAIVNAHDFQIAPQLVARRLLRNAVARVREGTRDGRSEFEALAARLSPMLKTALRTGVDTGRLRQFGSRRAAELADVVDTYRGLLREQHSIDSEELLLFASTLEPAPQPLYLHGYFRARPQEVVFINAVCGEGSVLVLPTDEAPMFEVNRAALEQFRGTGWAIEAPGAVLNSVGATAAQRFRSTIAEAPTISATAPADIDAESRSTVGQIKSLLAAGASPASIAVVAREPARYGPTLAAIAGEYGVPLRRTYRIALAETRLGRWLSLLLDAVRDDFPFEATVRLVAHPLGAGIAVPDWRLARAAHTYGIEAWLKLAPSLEFLRWPERDTRANWLQTLKHCLATVAIRAQCGDSARDLAALDLLETELSGDFHGQETLHREEFADEVSAILNDLETEAEPGTGGVELHEPQSIIGARFDHLFVLGLSDGVLPQQPADNPVIDFYERRLLRAHGVEFESAVDIARWEDLAFHFLLETARTGIHLSYPQMVDRKPRLPSVYFARLGVAPTVSTGGREAFSRPEWRRYALGVTDENDAVVVTARRAQRIELSRESSAAYDEFDGITGIAIDATKRTWSASQLLKLGQCPFHWFADKALRLVSPDEPMLGLAPDVRGRMYHKVLELVLAEVPENIDPREWALSRLDASLDTAERDDEVALPSLPAWPAQRLEHLEVLRRAIRSDDFIAPGARVAGLEAEFTGYWHGLRVYGLIDRVDQTPDGLVLIDYKTGRKPKGVKDEAGALTVDIQLPIYIEAAAPKLFPGQPVAGGNYFSIARAEILAEVGSEPALELAEFADGVRTRLAEGKFPVEPDARQDACTFCAYTPVCRRGHRLTRKPVS